MRLFVGIPLPKSYHDILSSMTSELDALLRSRVKWVEPHNAHITLRFLGDTSEHQLATLKNAFAAIEFPTFHLRFAGCVCIPNPQRPRLIWTEATKGARTCQRLAGLVEEAAVSVGFPPNERPFKAHATIGRIKKDRSDNWEHCMNLHNALWPGFKATQFILWESRLTPQGPVYSPIEEYPLAPTGNS